MSSFPVFTTHSFLFCSCQEPRSRTYVGFFIGSPDCDYAGEGKHRRHRSKSLPGGLIGKEGDRAAKLAPYRSARLASRVAPKEKTRKGTSIWLGMPESCPPKEKSSFPLMK
jgi:hypothetical protein